ncbi:cell wall hydrolase [Alkalihalobacterium alkalinitrilicum]|uniref:cell wall hydrolase n=1 Tax=Alkalihalobacterium alkalinitrilicum TaxID=427920 RepID=UPI0009958583|nr:cell wall hydrolase [Alkalihalobacterium alkalinitrilicum]
MVNLLTTLLLLTGAEVPEEQLPKLHEERLVYTIEKESEEVKVHAVRASLTVEEKELLERLVTAEAQNEPFEGKVAVAEVVLNRMENEQFPDELEDVVFQENQFCPVENGTINKKPTEKAKKAVEEAIKGTDEANGALYFYNDNIIKTSWLQSRKTTTRIGQHVFKQ